MNSAPKTKKPKLRTGYINIFEDSLVGCVHASGVFDSRTIALKRAGETCLDTVRIRYRPRSEMQP